MVVVAVSGLTLPAIDPDLELSSRPLESVTMVALVLPISVAVHMCRNRLDWLALTSPRPTVLDEFMWFVVVYLAQWAGLTVLIWSAPEVPSMHLLAIHSLLTALALLAYRTAGPLASSTVPLTLVAVFSVPDLIPWQMNLLYNLDQSALLRISTFVAVPILTVVTVRLPQRP